MGIPWLLALKAIPWDTILANAPAILRKMLWNPRTDETIREFNTAWANRGK